MMFPAQISADLTIIFKHIGKDLKLTCYIVMQVSVYPIKPIQDNAVWGKAIRNLDISSSTVHTLDYGQHMKANKHKNNLL